MRRRLPKSWDFLDRWRLASARRAGGPEEFAPADIVDPGGGRQISVIIGCTDWFYGRALLGLLRETDGVAIVGAAQSPADILELAYARLPEVAVLDLPSRASGDVRVGYELIRDLRTHVPKTRVIVLGIETEDDVSVLLDLGVSGIFRRGEISEPRQIWSAIHSVAWDMLIVPQTAQRFVVGELPFPDTYEFSRREREILLLLALELSNKEIASRTNFAPQTVKNTVGSILRKLGVSNRHEAALVARRLLR